MKFIFLLLVIIPTAAFAIEPVFKKGDCISNNPQSKYVFLKVNEVDKKTEIYFTTVFARTKLNDPKSALIKFDQIPVTFSDQKEFSKVICLKN